MKRTLCFLAVLSLLFSSCQKETLTPPAPEDIIIEGRAPVECHDNLDRNSVTLFEYCTGEFVMQGELRLTNVNGFHFIEGSVKCHKQGAPGNLVTVAELSVELNGELSIGCSIPITVNLPSDYNANLVGGAVENYKQCNNCSSQLLRIDYTKEVNLIEGDDILKGKFFLKIDECGETFEEEIDLVILGD